MFSNCGRNVYRILIADDHPAIRIFMKQIVTNEIGSVNAIIDETSNLAELFELLKKNTYDMAILDIHLEDGTTLSALPAIKLRQQDMHILFFSVCPEDIYAQRAIQMGAQGFINKKASETEIAEVVKMILFGKRYLSQDFLFALLSNSESGFKKVNNPFLSLSAREFEVLSLLLAGKTNKEISNTVNLSTSTVSSHNSRIFERLNVMSEMELSQLAASFGLTNL